MSSLLGGPSGSDLRKKRARAKARELHRLQKVETASEEQTEFLTTLGKGLGAQATISLFDDDIDDEEETLRRTGQITDTGLFL